MMKWLFFLLPLLVCQHAEAQLSVERYREEVLAYSFRLKSSQERSRAAREEALSARRGLLPRLELAGSFDLSARHYTGREQWNFSLMPQIVQQIYAGGGARARRDVALLGQEMALCDEEFTVGELKFAADFAYWDLSAKELYFDAMRHYVELIEALKEVVDRRFAEGYISKADVLMIDARLSEARFSLLTAVEEREVALHNFNRLRGAPQRAQVALHTSLRDTIICPRRIPLPDILAERADYRAAQLAVERSTASVKVARAPFNPQLSLSAGPVWKPYYPNATGETVIDGVLAVRLSVPIFHFRERRHTLAAARAAVQISRNEAEQLRDDITLREGNGWTTILRSREQVAASEESLRIAGENLDISTYSYNEGLKTILDVMQAQLSWIQLYTNSIRSRFNYAVAVSDYRRITARE